MSGLDSSVPSNTETNSRMSLDSDLNNSIESAGIEKSESTKVGSSVAGESTEPSQNSAKDSIVCDVSPEHSESFKSISADSQDFVDSEDNGTSNGHTAGENNLAGQSANHEKESASSEIDEMASLIVVDEVLNCGSDDAPNGRTNEAANCLEANLNVKTVKETNNEQSDEEMIDESKKQHRKNKSGTPHEQSEQKKGKGSEKDEFVDVNDGSQNEDEEPDIDIKCDGSEKLFASSGDSDASVSDDTFSESFLRKAAAENVSSADMSKNEKPNSEDYLGKKDSVERQADHNAELPQESSQASSSTKTTGRKELLSKRKKGRPNKILDPEDPSNAAGSSSQSEAEQDLQRETKEVGANEGASLKAQTLSENKKTKVKEPSGGGEPSTSKMEESSRSSKRQTKRKEFADHVSFGSKRSSQKFDKIDTPASSSGKDVKEETLEKPKIKKEKIPAPVFSTPSPARGKKPSKSTYDKEKTAVPFTKGWMREVVHRATVNKANVRAVDIYYFTPEGGKLRSMPDVGKYLSEHKGEGLTLENFTFAKDRIYREPFEKERFARPRVGEGADTSLSQTPNSSMADDWSTPPSQKKTPKKSLPTSAKTKKLSPQNKPDGSVKKTPVSQKTVKKLKRTHSELEKSDDSEDTSSSDNSESVIRKKSDSVVEKSIANTSKTSSISASQRTSLEGKSQPSPKTYEKLSSTQQTPLSSKSGKTKIVTKLVKVPQESEASGSSQKKKKSLDIKDPPRKKIKIKFPPRKPAVKTDAGVLSTKLKR